MSTILLVENDPLQGFLCKAMLEREFHNVVRVSDVGEALCLVEQPQFAADLGLVISDLTMPGMGSQAFAAELHDRRPNIPILVLTPRGQASGASTGWLRFLSRPFASDQLLSAANELLAWHAREAAA